MKPNRDIADYQSRVAPNLQGFGYGSTERQAKRRQALQVIIVRLSHAVALLRTVRGTLMDYLDDPMPPAEIAILMNRITESGMDVFVDLDVGELARLLAGGEEEPSDDDP